MARAMTAAMAALADGSSSPEVFALVEVLDIDSRRVELTTDPDQTTLPTMKVVSGTVTIDRSRTIHGDGNITLMLDDDTIGIVLPTGAGHPLAPTSDRYLRVGFGVRNPLTGVAETASLGIFELANVNVDEVGGGVRMTADLFDLWRRVERARFYRPGTLGKGTAYEDAFLRLLAPIIPWSTISIAPTERTTPLVQYDVEGDRLGAVRELETAIGYVAWLDGEGDCIIEPDTDPTDDPQWVVRTPPGQGDPGDYPSRPNLVATRVRRALSDEKTYNGVIARGEAAGSSTPPVQGEAWDLRPDSPTYFDPAKPDESRYGPVPFFYVSPLITTTAQARTAAIARLPKVLGMAQRVTFNCLPCAGIEPGDLVWMNRPSVGITPTVFVVQAVTYPLTARSGAMSVTCRERVTQ